MTERSMIMPLGSSTGSLMRVSIKGSGRVGREEGKGERKGRGREKEEGGWEGGGREGGESGGRVEEGGERRMVHMQYGMGVHEGVCVNEKKSGEVCRERENGVNLEHCKWWRNCVINTGIVEQCAGPSRFVSHP